MRARLSFPPTTQPASGHSFWPRWTTASAIGAVPGLLVAFCLYSVPDIDTLLAPQVELTAPLQAARIAMLLLPGVLVGFGVGIGQRRVTPAKLNRWWVLVVTIGYGLLWCYFSFLYQPQTEVTRFITLLHPFLLLTLALLGVAAYLVLPQMALLGKIGPESFDWVIFDQLTIALIGMVICLPILAVVLLFGGEWHFVPNLSALVGLATAIIVQAVAAGLAINKRGSK